VRGGVGAGRASVGGGLLLVQGGAAAAAHATGRIKFLSGGSSSSMASIQASREAVMAVWNLARSSWPGLEERMGVAMAEPTSSRRHWISTSCASRATLLPMQYSLARPTLAFNSSTSPSAEKNSSSLLRRSPLYRELVPPSPVLVYTL